jgi:hypothetical protein
MGGDFAVNLGDVLKIPGLPNNQVLVGRLPGEMLIGPRGPTLDDLFRIPKAKRFGWLDLSRERVDFPPFDLPIPDWPIERPLPLVWPDAFVPTKIKWPPDGPLPGHPDEPWEPWVPDPPPIVPVPFGVPRDELAVPIAPDADPTDSDLFEDPAGTVKLALPRYDVVFDRVGAGTEPRVLIADRAGTPTLLVVLSQTPSPASGPDVAVLPHAVAVTLKYRVPVQTGGSVVIELAFESVTFDDTQTVVTAELPLSVAGLQQQLLAAMGSLDAEVTLVVKRGITVGKPTGDRGSDGQPLYWLTALLLEHIAAPTPLLLSDAQRIRLGGGGGPVQPMNRIRVPFGDRSHSYWQDPVRPERYYFVPDAFLLARLPGTGRPPALKVRATDAASAEEIRVTTEFLAKPVISPQRLETAMPVLAAEAQQRGSTSAVRMEILTEAQPILRLALPRDGASTSELTERPGAQIDLEIGVAHAETFPLADFRLVHGALFGASLSLLRGEVRVSAGGGPPEDVPLELRLEHTAGDVLIMTPTAATPTRITAKLTNGIESPVRLDRLSAIALIDGRRIPLSIEGLPEGKLLTPGEGLEISFVPAEPLPDKGADAIMLDQSGLAVQPDRETVWTAVFDDSAKPQLSRQITVEAVPIQFEGTQGDRVAAFVVTVVGAVESVQITEAQLRAVTTVQTPIQPLLTGTPIPPLRYRTETLWQSGGIGVSPWRTTDATILLPVKTAAGVEGDS